MKPRELPDYCADRVDSLCADASGRAPLKDCVAEALRRYLADLDGEAPVNLYEMVMSRVERPLLEVTMAHAGGNQCRAAQMLGINRNTLRKKLLHYGLND